MKALRRYALWPAALVVVLAAAVAMDRALAPSAHSGGAGAASAGLRDQTSLNSVACTPIGVCSAVGQTIRGSAIAPLAEQLDGGSWHRAALPAVESSAQLTAVSCVGAGFCIAVGGEPRGGALAELWRGGRWRQLRVAVPPGPATLAGISCVSPSFCIAVGSTKLEHSLVERWDGSVWTRMSSPGSTAPSVSPLRAVSCSDRGHCVAVGEQFTPRGVTAVIDRLTAAGWVRLPLLGTTANATMRGVSCVRAGETAASWCVIVGSSTTGDVTRPFALAVRGTSMTVMAPVGLESARFTGVSCTGVGSCIAVGAFDGRRRRRSFGERLAGFWALIAPSSLGAGTTLSGGISCVDVQRCESVGSARTGASGAIVAAAEALRGRAWTAVSTPGPA
jgi:hypothetical protein